MPYKDHAKRMEQVRRWELAHKDDPIRQERNKIREMARRAFPETQPCSISGCERKAQRHHPDYSKPLEIVWLCVRHHFDEHIGPARVCSMDGCEMVHRARGMCSTHHNQARRKSKNEGISLEEAENIIKNNPTKVRFRRRNGTDKNMKNDDLTALEDNEESV